MLLTTEVSSALLFSPHKCASNPLKALFDKDICIAVTSSLLSIELAAETIILKSFSTRADVNV